MAVFLILYERTRSFSTVPPVYFSFELVLPVKEGGSVRGERRRHTGKRVDCPLGEEPILRHSDFSAAPDTDDNTQALSEYNHRFFRKERWQG